MRRYNTVVLVYGFFTGLLLCNCAKEKNPLAPEYLSGSYTLVSYTDKRTDTFYASGIPTDDGSGLTTSYTGTLKLTETEFELVRTTTFFPLNNNPQIVTEVIVGNYYVNENHFIIVEKTSGRSDSIPILVSGKSLILEDFEFKFVYLRK